MRLKFAVPLFTVGSTAGEIWRNGASTLFSAHCEIKPKCSDAYRLSHIIVVDKRIWIARGGEASTIENGYLLAIDANAGFLQR